MREWYLASMPLRWSFTSSAYTSANSGFLAMTFIMVTSIRTVQCTTMIGQVAVRSPSHRTPEPCGRGAREPTTLDLMPPVCRNGWFGGSQVFSVGRDAAGVMLRPPFAPFRGRALRGAKLDPHFRQVVRRQVELHRVPGRVQRLERLAGRVEDRRRGWVARAA